MKKRAKTARGQQALEETEGSSNAAWEHKLNARRLRLIYSNKHCRCSRGQAPPRVPYVVSILGEVFTIRRCPSCLTEFHTLASRKALKRLNSSAPLP